MWRRSRVAPGGTHHVVAGEPLYERRFRSVLPFHEPGLAPVEDESGAYHISTDGHPAYEARFLRTFGFYGGLSAVITPAGWHHIRPDGSPAYRERYTWAGNFQAGRCTVRDSSGGYFHIGVDGEPAYAERYRYAGDYREGSAVVQRGDGLSIHIDTAGRRVHETAWLDLDIFHKGFARARDRRGWTHIDRAGRPLYEDRYAMVEPFYNGQARVEGRDGRRLVIDEGGREVLELRERQGSPFAELSGDLVGYWRTYTAGAAAELGIVGLLPSTAERISAATGLPLRNSRRLLAAMGEMGLVRRNAGTWETTEKGAFLDPVHPTTLHPAAIEYARHMVGPWRDLPRILAGERPSDQDLFRVVADDADRVDGFHRMLTSYALHDYGRIGEAIDLQGEKTLIDAGGGAGIVAGFLLRAHPQMRVVLMDRPEVLGRVAIPDELRPRFRTVPGDLLEPWPVRGDAVLMARVLHDWDDERCLRILRHARGALDTGGTLFLAEMVLEPDDFNGSLCSLHLLVNTGGAERTLDEYRAMLAETGFDLQDARRLDTLPTVLRAVAR